MASGCSGAAEYGTERAAFLYIHNCRVASTTAVERYLYLILCSTASATILSRLKLPAHTSSNFLHTQALGGIQSLPKCILHFPLELGELVYKVKHQFDSVCAVFERQHPALLTQLTANSVEGKKGLESLSSGFVKWSSESGSVAWRSSRLGRGGL